jgi:lipopolysaccharide/colanic/teichoic acid biosynthesis glycosyltransferase
VLVMANVHFQSGDIAVGRQRSSAPVPIAEHADTAVNFLLALGLFIFILPLLVMIALAVLCQDSGPVVFAHKRIGRNGRPFYCLKFRSMAADAEARLAEVLRNDPVARAEWEADRKLKNDPRITRLGHFLRKSSLDELPQLWNVMRGEMSLVGPRPIVFDEAIKYGRRFRDYCAVKPGITGLWQVSGRNDVSYRARVAMDSLYARRKSPVLDAWILLATVPAVLCRRGSY